MTTLLIPDGVYTSNLNETSQATLNHLITIDDQTDDTEYHKRIRKQIKEPKQMTDFTPAEVKNAIEDLKGTREDGITGVIYQRVYKLFPTLTYTIYGECLRTGSSQRGGKKSK